MKTLIALFVAVSLVGCAGSDYGQYVKAQSEANRLAVETQKPLVRLTAQPGQAITGLAGLEVYMPTSAPVIQQARPNEWVGLLGQGLGIAGTVIGIREAGKAAVGLADSVGRAGTTGYQYIQTPQANVSTVTTTTTTTDSSNRAVTTDSSNHSVSTAQTTSTTSSVGDNSGSNSGNSGRIAGADMSDATSVPIVVSQPEPVVVTQPAPVVVTP